MKRPSPALLRLITFSGTLIGVAILLIAFRSTLLALFLGLAVAYLLDPLVSWFERHGRSRVFGTVTVTFLVLVLVVAFFLYLVPAIGDQVQRVSDRMPAYSARFQAWAKPWMSDLQARYPEQVAQLQERAKQALRENLPRLAGSATHWMATAFSSVLHAFLFLLNLVFAPVFAFYLLIDFPKVKRGIVDLVPLAYRTVFLERVGEVDGAVSGFVRGQLTIALILATLNSIGLVALGVPLGLLLGILAGLANVIPYMSFVVGLLPAMLLSWVETQSLAHVVGVAALFTATQLLEGTFLSPRILGRTVHLHPVWVLLAVIIGGSVFGFLGMLIAVPGAAIIQVFTRHWLASYRRSQIYLGPPGGAKPSEAPDQKPAAPDQEPA